MGTYHGDCSIITKCIGYKVCIFFGVISELAYSHTESETGVCFLFRLLAVCVTTCWHALYMRWPVSWKKQ
jgi:hypothetical protein